jgi:GAF domain-containing protein
MAVDTPGDAGWESLPAPQEIVFDSQDVENFLSEVTHEFMRDIGGDRRGIGWAATLLRQGDARTVAAGSVEARAADWEQCSFGDGPVLAAMRTGEFVLVSDLGRDRRWPGYANAAAQHGVGSLLSMPIVAAGGSSAAINLYAPTAHAFTSEDIIRTGQYAREVARALRVVLRVAERAEASAELAVAQSSLLLMDLAVRTLMTDYGLSHEGALQYLRTAARHTNRGLREAALTVVTSGSAFAPGGHGQEGLDIRQLIPADSPPPDKAPYGTGGPA